MDFNAWFTVAIGWINRHSLQWNWDVICIILGLVTGGLAIIVMAISLRNYRLDRSIRHCQQVEAKAQASAAHYRTLIHALPDLIMRINRAGVYVDFLASPNFSVFGHSVDRVGTHVTEGLPPDLAQQRLEAIQKVLNTQAIETYEQTLSIDGRIQVEQVRVLPYSADEVLLLVQNISDRIKIEEQLKYDALHDKLTGLPNRSLLLERLELALKRINRHPETQLAVLFLDLDKFKVVNDSLGHFVGDKLLLAIAEKLRLVIREIDLAARLGGDEFIVLLEEISDLSEAIMVAERILDVLQSPINIADHQVLPGVSIGIATSKHNHDYTACELLRDADVAMYWAKRRGRGQYAVFDASMHLQVVTQLKIENNLRTALESNQFLLYYQPIVNLKTQKIEAFEALLRWQHPQEGLLGPERFIDVAKAIGLMAPIDDWVLHTACQQLVLWQTQFPESAPRVNVKFLDGRLKEARLLKLEEVFAIYHPVANSLMLEITENMLVQDFEMVQRLLHRLKAVDVGVVMDDFGLGYSCLQYLYQLPIQVLKIDQGFMGLAELNDYNQRIAESIITLCQSLQLTTIAAGVNAQQQLSWLRDLGCDAVQGECFAGPMSVTEATELLERKILLESEMGEEERGD